MQNVSDKFITAMRVAPYTVRLTLDNTDIIQGRPMQDSAIQSMTYSVGSGDTTSVVTVGSTVSTSVSLELDRSLVTVPLKGRTAVIGIGIELEGGIEWLNLGSDIVADVQENDDIITLTCHSVLAVNFETTYKPITGIDFSHPVSALALVRDICARHGVAVELTGMKDITLQDFDPEGCTDREIIGWLAALYGKFAIIDRTGILRFRWFEPSGHTISADDYYDGEIEKRPEAIQIAWIQCYTELLEETLKAGDTAGEYGIAFSCPWMTQERLDEIWTELDGFAYTPVESISVFGDPRIDLGDTVRLETLDGGASAVPVMYISHDWDGGIITDISAQSPNDGDVTEGAVQRENKRTRARIVKKQNAIEMAVEDAQGNLSKLEQTAGEVHVVAQKTKVVGVAYTFKVDGDGNLVVEYSGEEAPGYSINENGELVLEYEGDTPPDTWIDENGVLQTTDDSVAEVEVIGSLETTIDGEGVWESTYTEDNKVISSIRFDFAKKRFVFNGDIVVGDELTNSITAISRNAIDVEYLNALEIKAGSVDAENITGEVITGKRFVGATGEFSGVLIAGEGSSLGGFKTDWNSLFVGEWSHLTPEIFMCTGTNTEYTIAGHTSAGWTFGVSDKWGVTKDGGMFSVKGQIGGWYIEDDCLSSTDGSVDGVRLFRNYLAFNDSEKQVSYVIPWSELIAKVAKL